MRERKYRARKPLSDAHIQAHHKTVLRPSVQTMNENALALRTRHPDIS